MTVLTGKLLDVSNWDAPTFDANCLKAQGVDSIILGCQIEPVADTMARDAQRAGIRIMGVYVFLKDAGTPIPDGVAKAIRIAQKYGARRVWLDCEQSGLTAAEIASARVQVENAGLLPGIYTGKYVWGTFGASDAHKDLPLWHAEYGQNTPSSPSRAPVTEVSYGGWTRPDIHQYSSVISACGRNRDHNYLFDWAQDAQGDGMTADELNAAMTKREQLRRIASATSEDDGKAYADMLKLHEYARKEGMIR